MTARYFFWTIPCDSYICSTSVVTETILVSMAPNRQEASGKKRARNTCDELPVSWLDKHGQPEYKAYKDATLGQCLSFDAWKISHQHTNGLSLYYKTLDILEESDSTDEDSQPVKAKAHTPKIRGQVGRPRKSASVGSDRLPRLVGAAKSPAVADTEDLSPSAKKKRKARKKPLSEEIVASASDSGEGTQKTDGALAEAVEAPSSGRKSSARKTKKKPICTAPKTPAPAPTLSSPKKTHILKLSTRKTPKEKTVSDDNIRRDDTNIPIQATSTTLGAYIGPSTAVDTDFTSKRDVEASRDVGSAAVSPDTTNAAAGSTRRGLRTRKPAQQRPYYHDSQLFENVEPTNEDGQETDNTLYNAQSRRVSIASLSRNVDDALLASLDEEAIALLEEEPELGPARPKHFKGKGRAWKKEGSDEDEEFSLAAKKKAAKAAKMKAKGQAPKKRGRPRKSGRSEEVVEEEIDEEVDVVKRKRPPPRKSALSEEIVPDSSDGGEGEKEVEESTTPKYSPDQSSTPKNLLTWMRGFDEGAKMESTLGTCDDKEAVSPSGKHI
ncbi:hypothetical protein GMOD_00000589 [Pyrenophora seminiperda CCB06]|uniref:Uncharacterized protein n=1 Tax=Pyrenophora seminiperda CCB06 TaxID=1302712 RepID=A0A3M7M7X5_9PLEO|nr:hypothetical protein GMOD_00000589 [Pyrenophora seminiperda CCB06]